MGYLRNALQHIRSGELPWRGPELHGILPANSTVVESYPWLDAIVAALRNSGERKEPGSSARPAIAGHVQIPIAIPYEMALLAHPPGTGTRMIFSIAGAITRWVRGPHSSQNSYAKMGHFRDADVPLPPDMAELDRNGPLGGVNLTVAVPGGRSARMHTGRRRICGRRMVALGQKPLLVGGVVEGSAFRNFASRQVGAAFRHDQLFLGTTCHYCVSAQSTKASSRCKLLATSACHHHQPQ